MATFHGIIDDIDLSFLPYLLCREIRRKKRDDISFLSLLPVEIYMTIYRHIMGEAIADLVDNHYPLYYIDQDVPVVIRRRTMGSDGGVVGTPSITSTLFYNTCTCYCSGNSNHHCDASQYLVNSSGPMIYINTDRDLVDEVRSCLPFPVCGRCHRFYSKE
jgi:hypothetical protein